MGGESELLAMREVAELGDFRWEYGKVWMQMKKATNFPATDLFQGNKVRNASISV
jgi:hypothetical protein